MIRRLFRLTVLAAIVAGIVAAVRSLTSSKDPLPTPAATPSEPWPPLSSEPALVPEPVEPVVPEPVVTAPVVTEPVVTEPVVTAPEPDGVPVSGAAFVEPDADGECPDGYPIKAKMSSKIFHAPGQLNYDRTTPDRCYRDASGATADGLRAAKR